MSYGMYWLWVIVLSVFTFGIGTTIYQYVIYFQLLNRRNDHFARQHRLIEQVIMGLREAHGGNQEVASRLSAADATLEEMRLGEGPRNPWLWVLLWPLLTLGIAAFWTVFWLTVDWRRHSMRQQRITDDLSAVFRALGYSTPNIIDEGVSPERSYWWYLLFTVLTLGLFSIYWLYIIFKDGNRHMQSDEFMEDQLLNTLRAA
jgi:hypothetical protein